jgi:hypothetical protein
MTSQERELDSSDMSMEVEGFAWMELHPQVEPKESSQ